MTTENSSLETAQTSASSDTGTSSSGTTETTAAATTSTPDIAASSDVTKSTEAAQPSVDGQAPVVPSWQPNYKFKAFGKEHEIGPEFRNFIKDADTEKAFRKLHEKAYALEPLQADRDRFRTELETFKSSNEPTLRAVNQLNKLLTNKDYDNFFSGLGIKDEEIFNWVSKKLDIMNMPPDQKAQFEQQQQLRMEKYQLEHAHQEMQQQYQQQAVQARTMQLDSVLSRPDVGSYAQQWDSKTGEIGSFRSLIVEEARAEFAKNGHDMSAEEAVNHVIKKFGKIVGQPQAIDGGSAQPGIQASPQFGQQQKPPIIPHVAGRGTSPIKKVPKSLDDIKKMVAALPAD